MTPLYFYKDSYKLWIHLSVFFFFLVIHTAKQVQYVPRPRSFTILTPHLHISGSVKRFTHADFHFPLQSISEMLMLNYKSELMN